MTEPTIPPVEPKIPPVEPKITVTFADLTDQARKVELAISLKELDEIAELRRIVAELTETEPVLYSTA